MDPVIRADDPADLEARRMELRGTIRLASEVIAQYWPMRTFVHHNPLHSLEYLPFTETPSCFYNDGMQMWSYVTRYLFYLMLIF